MKKKMYYNMRVKTVRRNMTDILCKMDMYKGKLEEFPHERIKALYNVLKEVSIKTLSGGNFYSFFPYCIA